MGTLNELREQDTRWAYRQVEKEIEDREWARRMEDGDDLLHPYEREDEEHRREMEEIRREQNGFDMIEED
jgi:hypothetical protein